MAAVVGVATVEVAVAVAATVGAVTRSLRRRRAEGCGFGGDVVAGEREWPDRAREVGMTVVI